MTKRDTLVVDLLALPNLLDRLYYIISPLEERSLIGLLYIAFTPFVSKWLERRTLLLLLLLYRPYSPSRSYSSPRLP